MRHTVRSDDVGELSLCEGDETRSILQNIRLLLTTRQGSVPMYRQFGLPMRFVDKPVYAAQTIMAAEVREALEEFEKRAAFVDISFEYNDDFPGRLIAIVEVDI